MTRVRPLTEAEVAPEVAATLRSAAKTFGKASPATGIQAYCPPILEASRALAAAPARSQTVEAELRYLICLRVAQVVRCPF